MKLAPAQQLTIRRMEDVFAREYLRRAIKSLPLFKWIAFKCGSRKAERIATDRAHTMLMRDIEKGILPDRYEREIIVNWDEKRLNLIGGHNLQSSDELNNLKQLRESFDKAQMMQEVIERPDYMVSPYDPMRQILRG